MTNAKGKMCDGHALYLTITGVREEMAAHFSHDASGATIHYNLRC